jgi:hypothetical protein
MLFRLIDAVYARLGLGKDKRVEMGDRDDSAHPMGEGLQLTDVGTAREFQEHVADEVQVGLLPGDDPRLAEVSLTFVDEDGVSREWSVTHDDYHPEEYHD